MDFSGNYYDLLYFVNPSFLDSIEKPNNNNIIDNEDLLFYKRRIFTQTRDFLNGKQCDNLELNKIFNIYAQHCIEFFKFKDRSAIIQNEYSKYNKKKSTASVTDVSLNNNLFMREKPPRVPKITDHIIIKNKKQKSQVIPKIRKIDLKNEKYKGKK